MSNQRLKSTQAVTSQTKKLAQRNSTADSRHPTSATNKNEHAFCRMITLKQAVTVQYLRWCASKLLLISQAVKTTSFFGICGYFVTSSKCKISSSSAISKPIWIFFYSTGCSNRSNIYYYSTCVQNYTRWFLFSISQWNLARVILHCCNKEEILL